MQGSATPVPGTDVLTPSGNTTPAPVEPASDVPANSAVARFMSVAPATGQSPKYAISPAIEYQLGMVVTSSASDKERALNPDGTPQVDQNGKPVYVNATPDVTPIHGWLRYPVASASPDVPAGRYPVILFLHGNHTPAVPNYQGYDYLAQDLAQQGYVVLSLDANAINAAAQGDRSSQSRAQLLLGTLDRLRQIDANGGPGVLSALRGKLDFERVGIMGHSRGGQGVSYAIKYNLTRVGVTQQQFIAGIAANPAKYSAWPDLVAAAGNGANGNASGFDAALAEYNMFYAAGGSAAPYNIRAGILLAPTDYDQNVGVSNVPVAMVAATCDGNVISMDGAHAYDLNRFGTQYDTAPRFQVVVNGANHNYFNTIWTQDDVVAGGGQQLNSDFQTYCSPTRADTPRLSADDQRRVATFVVNSFMRYFVGGEAQFAGYWSTSARLPATACPGGAETCDERVLLSVQKDATRSRVLQRFEYANALAGNALGGALVLSGFDQISACTIPYSPTPWSSPSCIPASPDAFIIAGHLSASGRFGGGGYVSIADAARLVWSAPNAKISEYLQGASAAGYDSLTFRIAVVRPMGQEVAVTLTDTKGASATVNASDFSDAVYLAPKPKGAGRPLIDDPQDVSFSGVGAPMQLLNMVAIPLAAFTGVDTTSLARVDLALPKASGMLAFTDLEFQNLGRGSQ
ncbi:dienelactone hydrolase [Paraburkholderia bannensis]|uniref:Dienelactone hydrolase n=1 Tax=Paraburkholderia bannensis TaxID=765414 RepID=A0A7W9WS93_9BURK|nr:MULTISPECIES: hypothetical protein [Paraburkholderia]MBB3257102.1 dienelactone hydrolase [Paraburkholderia sp. WP4_3_2]MBB6102056.1 dienelactone hydrolase [Paraburkholderia bannensis]